MPKCFSAWNAVLNKSVTMHFRHEKQMKHNGTRWMKIFIFYSLIMPFSCATCMSTLGCCIIIFLFSGSLPSTTLHYNACAKHFPVLLCTTKLAQRTSQYYFVLQSLHKVLPSTTLYYKACTKHFPVLLCTTKLAQTTSQHYFVLQSLHKALPSTTLYYKACTNYFPILLCTTKLAQSTSQYYFVLQSLHKLLPSTTQHYFVLESLHKARSSTTLYYKACTKHVPVLLCTTKLARINDATTTWRRRDADPTTTRRATRGEFCMLIVISYVIS